ncbi:MAG: hypothetical protein KTR24_00085 [Saprospiraceae bacterium]|nr:hypothetical protein [Saprospiraceae bacterium]
MARKYKVTGCAKFFFVIIILAPLAYIGASYYNGQDPFDTISNIFGSDGDRIEQTDQSDELQARIRDLEKQLADCQEDNAGN